MDDTIFALSSGRPPSAIAVVRVSGPAAGSVLATLTGRAPPPPRRASLRWLRDAAGGRIDEAVVLWWPGPASFTGEDVAEFQVHGSRAVVAALLAALAALPGCRPAAAGEFSRRAFLNGRMDLIEIEALGDLIAAETESQRRSALAQRDGGVGRVCEEVRRRILDARADFEATIDFADEGDVADGLEHRALADLTDARAALAALLARGRPAERLRDGLTVVLAGPPNAGKSSLMNALAGRDVAIVSPEAGTTRDAIEVDLDLGGYPVRVVDTAGLRDDAAAGAIEREGMRRTRQRAAAADLVLVLQPCDDPSASPDLAAVGAEVWLIRSKDDRGGAVADEIDEKGGGAGLPALSVSVRRPDGLDALLARLGAFAAAQLAVPEQLLVLQTRQRDLLTSCVEWLDRALTDGVAVEVRAELARRAGDALAAVVGLVSTEDVLGRIFARFCIGK